MRSSFWVAPVLACAGLLTGTLALAQQKLMPASSEIVFVSKQMGVPVQGQFTRFDAELAFDPAQPQASKVAFTVDTGSATLGVKETDAELPKPVWFNVAKFPQARFESSAIRKLDAGKYEVDGTLAIKGASQPLTLPVVLTQAGDVTTATGSFVIKRLVFKIGENEWADTSMVADDVQVKFKFALTGVGKL
ncbi:YceI family protein [Comamonas faecalis]|uniref:YceI family protein n=1 Tax=Comamonas faecalis TaxID=1387849 RepID=A0ABP7R6L3_9BURK